MTHACNPSYLESGDLEGDGTRSAQAKSVQDPISKITREKWTRGVAQLVEKLFHQV
jgi:hypothetical protein